MARLVHLRSFVSLTALPPPCAPPLAAADLPPGAELPPAGWIDPVPRPAARQPRFGRFDRLAQLAFVTASRAVEQAGGVPARDVHPPAGVALGSQYGSHLSNELFWRGQRGPAGPSPSLFAYTLPSAAAAEISMHFGLTGPLLTLTGSADSGLAAFGAAASFVEAGAAGCMLAVAADVLSPSLLAAAGEGAAAHLEEAACCAFLDSEADGGLALLAGCGQACGPAAAERALDAALEQAGLGRADLRLLVAPGAAAQSAGGGYSELRGMATAPLLAAEAALRAGELPLAVLAAGPISASALCWAPT